MSHIQPHPSRHSRFSEVRELARDRVLHLTAIITGLAASSALLSAMALVIYP